MSDLTGWKKYGFLALSGLLTLAFLNGVELNAGEAHLWQSSQSNHTWSARKINA